jgi:hypothetical protein
MPVSSFQSPTILWRGAVWYVECYVNSGVLLESHKYTIVIIIMTVESALGRGGAGRTGKTHP